MTKKLFSFAMMMCLAIVGAWADEVTTVSSQTQWTFGDYAGQTVKVLNRDGIYLHSSQAESSYTDFTVDTEHPNSTSGTFSSTTTTWETTGVLVVSTGVGSNFLTMGNIDAASADGADASLAFNHNGSGRLHIVYGAASATGGTFYVLQRQTTETAFSTIHSEAMPGITYPGELGARPYNRTPSSSDYKFSQQEAVVSLSGSGTVYLGASQPYCIYAIFWVPTYLDNDIYGTYDFQTWAEANISAKDEAYIGLTSDGIMTGAFTPKTDGVTMSGTMPLNGAFSISGNSSNYIKLRKNGSTGNANSGLMVQKSGAPKLTINRLQAGDWFTITTDVDDRLQFATSNTNVHAVGSTETVTQDSYVQSGTVYIATAATTVDVYSKAVGTVYIHKVQISNEDGVSVPVISVDGSNQVTINGGTSLKGNPVTIYYTTDNTDPTTSTTRQVYSAPFTPTETVKVRAYSVLTSDETVASAEATPAIVRIGTWTGETNVFDFASAAANYVDITFGETALEGINGYNLTGATFYPITNTDWLTATDNTAVVAWRNGSGNAAFENGGLVSTNQKYFVVKVNADNERVKILFDGAINLRSVNDDDFIILKSDGSQLLTSNTIGGGSKTNTEETLTVQKGGYVLLQTGTGTVIKKISVLPAVQNYALTTEVTPVGGGTITDAEGNPLSAKYQEGSSVTLKATPAEGYQFVEWTDADDNRLTTLNEYTTTINAATTLKAVFKQPTTPAVAITEAKTWTFDGFTTGTKLSGTKVYEFDGLYISGHNDDTKNQAIITDGAASTGIAGDVTKYLYIAGKNNTVTANTDPSTFTTDAVALKTGPGIVEFYDKGKGTNRYFNVFVNGTKYQTEMTQTESVNDFQLIRQDAYAATNSVFFSSSDGAHQLYAVKFTPEVVTAPTISASGTITNGTSNLTDAANITMVTYYTTDGSTPTTGSTLSTGSIKTEGNFTVKAISVNSVTGTQSEVVEQAVTVTLPSNLGSTIPVILVAGQSNTDGRVPAGDLPSIDTEYTGLQNCYWSYCNAQKVYSGSGLTTSYTSEGNFQLYSALNDNGGGWSYDAVVYNEIGKYLETNYEGDYEKFYVVKQSKGNTAISPAAGGCGLFWSANPLWLSRNTSANEGGQSLLKGFIGNIEASLTALKAQYPNTDADIKFLMWHQGECDGAGNQGVAYYTQLKAMINYVRNYLATKNAKYSNLPIILGGIPTVSDQYRAEVEAAKQQLANEDVNIYYVAADMITSKENDLIQESTTVHFNAESAKAFGAAVWQTINNNHLLYGLKNGTGSDTPVADILAETVVSTTTKWDFSEEAANTSYSANTDKNGLYVIASSSKNATVKEMSGITSVKYRDSEVVNTTKALYTEAADRSARTKYGLTAGDCSDVDRSFGVNVSEAGTFYAIVAPNTEPTEAQAARTMFLVVNGTKVAEVKATDAWNNDNHLVELKYKMTEPGTIYLMSAHPYNLYAAKFVKSGEELDPKEVEVETAEATETVTIFGNNNAELTTVTVNEGTTTLTIGGTVADGENSVPITTIANNAFTAENTANVAAIDLSETAITLEGNRSELSALKNINAATLIYLPATASVTGTNVVIKTVSGGDVSYACEDYQLTDGNNCVVPHDFTATSAKINRTFTANKKCTVCLPFAFTATGGTFYKFTGLNDRKIQMTAQSDNSTLEANTPYIFQPEEGKESIDAQNVWVSISDAPQTANTEAHFTFVGTYEPIVWEAPVGIYGFAAQQLGLAEVGQFVRVGSGASIKACRAYLQYSGEGSLRSEASARHSLEDLPESFDIEWIPAASATSITTVKEPATDDAPVYNLQGQRVDDGYKGIVIKNGKTMIRK